MKLIVFKDQQIAINIEHIDGIQPHLNNTDTYIWTSGSDKPFTIHKPFDEVIKIIKERVRVTTDEV